MRRRNLIKRTVSLSLAALLLFAGCGSSEQENLSFDIVGNTDSNIHVDTTAPAQSDIYVEKNPNITADFITGMDISSYLSIVDSGATFFDYEGNALTKQGFFDLLAQSGTNYIRVRVWNNPYDSEGHGYGGGNCDLSKAIEIGQYATNAGMKLQVDFHYSDFWADPGKQYSPKAWADLSVAEKASALHDYTEESLKALIDAGVDVGIVQLGNETTNKLCDEADWADIGTLLNAGASAVRSVSEDIMISIHLTDPQRTGNYVYFADSLDANRVDYDIFASSYYPYWHGSLDNLTSVLSQVAEKYNKKILLTETSWAYTLEDGDGFENTVKEGLNDRNPAYEFSQQGQANAIASAAKAITDIGNAGIGIFYWEPAWIPVEYAYDENGNLLEDVYASNQTKWETFGSGWATSYATEYDAKDAGKFYGGSAVDNQALFDFTGHPLETLKIYSFLRTGTTAPKPKEDVKETASKPNPVDVEDNLLTEPGFEEELTHWTVENFDTFDASSNAKSGKGCLHFYAATAGTEFTATQEVTLDKGTYSCSAFLQGGDATDTDKFTLYITVDDTTYEATGSVSTWQIWQQLLIENITISEDNTTVTVGISVTDTTAGVWGSFDDCILSKTADL